jgi:hypothetical protein
MNLVSQITIVAALLTGWGHWHRNLQNRIQVHVAEFTAMPAHNFVHVLGEPLCFGVYVAVKNFPVRPDSKSIGTVNGQNSPIAAFHGAGEIADPRVEPFAIRGCREPALLPVPTRVGRVHGSDPHGSRVDVVDSETLFKADGDGGILRSRKKLQQLEILHRRVAGNRRGNHLHQLIPNVFQAAQPDKSLLLGQSNGLYVREVRTERVFHLRLDALWASQITTFERSKGQQSDKSNFHKRSFLAMVGSQVEHDQDDDDRDGYSVPASTASFAAARPAVFIIGIVVTDGCAVTQFWHGNSPFLCQGGKMFGGVGRHFNRRSNG